MVMSRPVTVSSSRRTFIPYASSLVRTTASITCSSSEPSSILAGSLRTFIATSPSGRHCSGSSRTLLLAQHHHWIGEARTPRRNESGEHAYPKQDQHRGCERKRVGRLNTVEQRCEDLGHRDRRRDPDRAAHCDQARAAPDHLA